MDPALETHLIAVGKEQPPERILPVLRSGQRLFGENRVQEAKVKWSELRAALVKLAELADTQRLQELELKSRVATLDHSELQEFQRLTTNHPSGKASGP